MKKRLLLLLTCLAFFLTGCGEKKADAPAALSCRELADLAAASAAFLGMTDANQKYLEKSLLISADDLKDWVFRRDAEGASPEMILILEVKEGADQAAIKKAVQDYLEERILLYRDYQPDQLFKLENAKVLEKGRFIALCVSPDAEKTVSALGDGWK